MITFHSKFRNWIFYNIIWLNMTEVICQIALSARGERLNSFLKMVPKLFCTLSVFLKIAFSAITHSLIKHSSNNLLVARWRFQRLWLLLNEYLFRTQKPVWKLKRIHLNWFESFRVLSVWMYWKIGCYFFASFLFDFSIVCVF